MLAQLALPLIGRVAAGSPILAQEHVDKTYYVENSLFQRQPDYLLKVRGMSMRDAGIMDGDLLAVQATKEAKNGQIVVARLGDDVTLALDVALQDLREPAGTMEVVEMICARLGTLEKQLVGRIVVSLAPSIPQARQASETFRQWGREMRRWTWSPKNWTAPPRAVELAWRGKLYDSAEALAAAKAAADWDVEL